jgi:hypothetical protein
MTKAHTPAPWETGEASWNDEGEVRYTLHGVTVAKVSDARLIAAAPDLLEALEEIVADYDEYKRNRPMTPDLPHIKKARAAIAKARGEAI